MMTDRQFRETIGKGVIESHYLLASNEGLLIDNAIKAIKEALKVDESFDLDIFSLSETPIEEIASRLYITPLASARRLLVVRDLEELDNKDLISFADLIGNVKTDNCIVMVYRIEKEKRNVDNSYRKMLELMPALTSVIFTPDKELIHKLIINKVQRDNLKLSSSVIGYLEEEFKNDVTGLKNEFEKIDNYLHETKKSDIADIKDLAVGLCDFDRYVLADEFYDGKPMLVEHFERLKPYLSSYAEIVAALTWGLVRRLRAKKTRQVFSNAKVKEIVNDIVMIDRKTKRSSYFAHLLMDIFLMKRLKFV